MYKILKKSTIILFFLAVYSISCYAQGEELNILGIKIGDNKEDAIKKISSVIDIKKNTIYYYDNNIYKVTLGLQCGEWSRDYQPSFNNYGESNNEGIILLFDQKNPDKIIGISREITFANKKRPTQNALLDDLRSKFGQETCSSSSSSEFIWLINSTYTSKDFSKVQIEIRDQIRFGFQEYMSTDFYKKSPMEGPCLNYDAMKNWKSNKFLYSWMAKSVDGLINGVRFILGDTDQIRESVYFLRDSIASEKEKDKQRLNNEGNKIKTKL